MTRRYCDYCNQAITLGNMIDDEAHRLTGTLTKNGEPVLKVEVMVAHKGTWNSGDFCKYCVIDAINSSDDRPRTYATPLP